MRKRNTPTRGAEAAVRHTLYIGIGSNIGDRIAHLREAVARLDGLEGTRVEGSSAIYMTEPVGEALQERFFNGVVKLSTQLDPEHLRRECKAIEHELGRPKAYRRWSPRVIDLDLLLCDDMVVSTPTLTLPHPELHKRKFVLVPLLDLGNPRHPVMKMSALELLQTCPDRSVPIKLHEPL